MAAGDNIEKSEAVVQAEAGMWWRAGGDGIGRGAGLGAG